VLPCTVRFVSFRRKPASFKTHVLLHTWYRFTTITTALQ
jgi:hypothetical protein